MRRVVGRYPLKAVKWCSKMLAEIRMLHFKAGTAAYQHKLGEKIRTDSVPKKNQSFKKSLNFLKFNFQKCESKFLYFQVMLTGHLANEQRPCYQRDCNYISFSHPALLVQKILGLLITSLSSWWGDKEIFPSRLQTFWAWRSIFW